VKLRFDFFEAKRRDLLLGNDGKEVESWRIMLMLQISQTTTWDGHKTLVNDGIFLYQPQLVQDFLHQHFFRKKPS